MKALFMRLIFIFLKWAFWSIIFLIGATAKADQSPSLMKVAYSKKWLRLLHVSDSHFNADENVKIEQRFDKNKKIKSRVEKGSSFFYAQDGYQNPYSELLANIDKFKAVLQSSDKVEEAQNPYCVFPARAQFLIREKLIEDRRMNCPKLLLFLEKLKFDKLYLIFAAQFNSNPTSMMGHTFFVFNDPKTEPYLSETFGYAALIPEDESLHQFLYKGLVGGFPGVFSTQKYYEKIHEYSNMETRDIWEYQVKLSEDQKVTLLYHLWELSEKAKIDYFFLDENCAFILLAAMEVLDPNLNLVQDHRIYLLPHESVKTFKKNKLLQNEVFRPSLSTQLNHSFKFLSANYRELFLKIREEKNIESVKTAVLAEALIDDLAIKKYRNSGRQTEAETKFEQELLVIRSEFGRIQHPKPPIPPSPMLSDDPMHYHVGFFNTTLAGSYSAVRLRPALHIQMDFDPGYLRNSAFNVLDTEVRISKGTSEQAEQEKSNIDIKQITFFEIVNNAETTALESHNAWSIRIKYLKTEDVTCYRCGIYSAYSRFGKSFRLTTDLSFSGFAMLESEASNSLSKGHRFWPGLVFQAYWTKGLNYKLMHTIQLKQDMIEPDKISKIENILQFRKYRILNDWDLDLSLTTDKYSFTDQTQYGVGLQLVNNF
jgi:hypothetical protein